VKPSRIQRHVVLTYADLYYLIGAGFIAGLTLAILLVPNAK